MPPKIHALTAKKASRLPSSISRLPAPGFATRILIVDQDRQLGVTLSFMLATRRYEEVRSVKSAKRALMVAEQFLPDIIFLELELPEGGGMSVARLLTRDARGRRPRIIALTQSAEESKYAEARAAGFERLLVKPILHEELDKIMGATKNAA